MIDNNKIKSAAQGYCDATFGTLDTNPFIAEAFRKGAKWAIQEFLKDLWHPASEKPVPVMGCNNGVLVELNETKKPITLWKREYLYENISKHGNRFISRWLYIDDLFQKEGGEHD